METILKIVYEFERTGHPLGKSIYEKEVPSLVSQLRQRLGMPESELDLMPESLKRLEEKLVEMGKMKWKETYSEEELVQLVREISAYLGEVMVLHAQGKWEPLGTLISTHLKIEGNVKVTKEGRSRIVPSVAFPLGGLAAVALDMASKGEKPQLYSYYLKAKRKELKEELKNYKK